MTVNDIESASAIDLVIGCKREHPRSIVFEHENMLNQALIVDKVCKDCTALDICSDFAQNRYYYKSLLKHSIENNKPFTEKHLCDWCGFYLAPKNESNYFCKGCGRTIKLEGLEQLCTKEIPSYHTPESVQELYASIQVPIEQPAPVLRQTRPLNVASAEKPPSTHDNKPQKGARSHKKGTGDEMFNKIAHSLEQGPLSYNEIVEAVPDMKTYKKPLNSLWSIIHKYGKDKIEYTVDTPVRIKLKCQSTS